MDDDVKRALDNIQSQLNTLNGSPGFHGWTHEIGGGDEVRPQWANGAIATKLNRQRTTVAGNGLTATEVQGADPHILLAFDTAVVTTGAWTSYTPQLDQGVTTNIAKTVTYAKYTRVGRTICFNVRLDITGAGTAGSAITITLPVTAAASPGPIGSAYYFDTSVPLASAGSAVLTSATQVGVFADGNTGNWVGGVPNIATANGDTINLSGCYEAAT